MKKTIIYTLLSLFTGIGFVACGEDGLSSESVIVDKTTEQNELDRWIEDNYTKSYNIDFIYRSDDREYNMSYNLVPPTYERSVAMAKLLLHVWLGTYDDVHGRLFTKTYIPKTIMLVGSGMYRSTSTVIGEAEGGQKITFARINELNLTTPSLSELVGVPNFTGNGTDATGVLKTAFHEFSHILTQNKPLPEAFALISQNDYVGDDWNASGTTPRAAWNKGFVTKYASHSPNEDFAEIVSIYIVRGESNWTQLLATAGTAGVTILNQKTEMINTYLKNFWGVTLDELRLGFEGRVANLDEIDLINLN
ncbi:MAG: putative zinc-binding metallopeptidase [Prevotella sp.]|nr:putative zinc-binding metallopeptidase [Prevotella sp.]